MIKARAKQQGRSARPKDTGRLERPKDGRDRKLPEGKRRSEGSRDRARPERSNYGRRPDGPEARKGFEQPERTTRSERTRDSTRAERPNYGRRPDDSQERKRFERPKNARRSEEPADRTRPDQSNYGPRADLPGRKRPEQLVDERRSERPEGARRSERSAGGRRFERPDDGRPPRRPKDRQQAARPQKGHTKRTEGSELPHGERLQKVLSRAGLASRREVEDWIRAGRITVNSELAVLGVRVGPSDQVRLDGRLIRQVQPSKSGSVYLIHRSPGEHLQQPGEVLDTSGADEASASSSMIDRIPRRAGRRFISVSPMPRIDGGLELVTSDGDLAAQLQRSMRGIPSEFSVRVHGELSPEGIETVLQGVLDTGEKLRVERCEPGGGEGSNRWYSVVTLGASGKDVRQLFERQGALVSRILRTRLGSLSLDRTLSRGRFRELAAEELDALLEDVSAEPTDEATERGA